jgi:hypothetical protein
MPFDLDRLFPEAKERYEKLLSELSKCGIEEVTGVVSKQGGGASSTRGEADWTVTFVFDVWRGGDGAIREKKLTLRKDVSDAELEELRKLLPAYCIVRVQARVAERNSFDSPQALLVAVLGREKNDPELEAHAKKLQEPVTFQHPRFGRFTLDRGLNWFRPR